MEIMKENNSEGKIVAISISENKGEKKTNVPMAELRENYGIIGDAHAGNWHRQISLLGVESIEKIKKKGLNVSFGDFAENITTEGDDIARFCIGSRLEIGESIIEITQIGKKCHDKCHIYEAVGDCVMPREGIFARVLKGGIIKEGDKINLIDIEEEVSVQSCGSNNE